MPLSSVELMRVEVPMRVAHRSAVADQDVRESILLRVRSVDGVEGESECPTLSGDGYVTESTASAWAALTRELASAALVGTVATNHAAPAASAALADAILALELRRAGVPLARRLAEITNLPTRSSIPWTAVIADRAVDGTDLGDALAASAAAAVSAGASMLKVKLTGPSWGGRIVEALRSAVDVPVALDANGTLDASDLAGLDGLGLAYLEQPLPPGTPWATLGEVAARCDTPICLDESLVSLDAVADALRSGSIDVANIKPSRIGGAVAAARAVALCERAGVDNFVGGMFELGLGRATAVGVASLGDCTLPTDLGPSRRYFDADVTEHLDLDAGGRLLVPDGIGCGRRLIQDRVDRYLVDRVVVGA